MAPAIATATGHLCAADARAEEAHQIEQEAKAGRVQTEVLRPFEERLRSFRAAVTAAREQVGTLSPSSSQV